MDIVDPAPWQEEGIPWELLKQIMNIILEKNYENIEDLKEVCLEIFLRIISRIFCARVLQLINMILTSLM